MKKQSVIRRAWRRRDLVSEMVGEFPDLQGVMGRYYAQIDDYPEAVCLAIEEHYMPVSASGELPQSDCGIVSRNRRPG